MPAQVLWRLLQFEPGSRLGRLAAAATRQQQRKLCTDLSDTDPPEFFFDRNPRAFNTILNYYRTGKVATRNIQRVIQMWNTTMVSILIAGDRCIWRRTCVRWFCVTT